MEITQLEFFLKIVEEGSFSKAAERAFRTQPALSVAIRRLEDEIGAQLFDRSQKTPALTEVGQVFHGYALRIIGLRDQAREVVADMRELRSGRVRVGANESTSLYLLPDIILAFRARFPQVKVEIYRHPSELLPREVLERNVDFALTANEPVDSDLLAFPVLKDELTLIMSPKHPLARRDSVNVKDLGNEAFLAHNVKTASRVKVIEAFAKHRTPLNITLELATVETIKQFVKKEVGIAFVPRMCVSEELERGTLASVPVRGLSYTRTLWVMHRRGATASHPATAFLEVLRKHARTQGI
jgi:DNA-binding transcriptional LysR family regulator